MQPIKILYPFLAFVLFLFLPNGRVQAQAQDQDRPFVDEPEAHALYDQMKETFQKADTLSWESAYRWTGEGGREIGRCTYKAWLKKPNYARLEVFGPGSDEPAGVLVIDGTNLWIHWPGGKPMYGFERAGKYGEAYEKYRMTYYMKKYAPNGCHSMGHETGSLGGNMSMTILDPSMFHGYTDSLQPYLDGVRSLGDEKVGEVECRKIEVSFMKGQRSWYLWLSKADSLPRKLEQVVRVSYDLKIYEDWSQVILDQEIEDDHFNWSAPEDWKEWRLPGIEEGLLPVGTEAPDFDLAALGGGRIKLSDYRGKVVWLYKWRCG